MANGKVFNTIAKTCSTSTFTTHRDGILKRRANKGMLIDMSARWGSTFLMLHRLEDLKCFVQSLGLYKSYLIESEWTEVKMVVKALQISHAATIYFQKQDLTPGECLLHWREVMFKLEKLDNNLASALDTVLQLRQEFLLRKEAFLAAVWVSSVCGLCCCDDLPIFFVDIIFNSILISVCALDFIWVENDN